MSQRRLWLGATLLVGGAVVALGAVVERLVVDGHSMSPTLQPGDRLLAVRRLPLKAGAVVAAEDPRQAGRRIVKRVETIDEGTGRAVLVGDNPDGSTDSRHYGPVDRSAVRSRVIFRYFPEASRVVVKGNAGTPRVAPAKD